MRLIDADAVLDWLNENWPMNRTDTDVEIQEESDFAWFEAMISAQPTASDTEGVIYCQHCSYSTKVDDVLYCTYWGKNTEEYGYCHHGD